MIHFSIYLKWAIEVIKACIKCVALKFIPLEEKTKPRSLFFHLLSLQQENKGLQTVACQKAASTRGSHCAQSSWEASPGGGQVTLATSTLVQHKLSRPSRGRRMEPSHRRSPFYLGPGPGIRPLSSSSSISSTGDLAGAPAPFLFYFGFFIWTGKPPRRFLLVAAILPLHLILIINLLIASRWINKWNRR